MASDTIPAEFLVPTTDTHELRRQSTYLTVRKRRRYGNDIHSSPQRQLDRALTLSFDTALIERDTAERSLSEMEAAGAKQAEQKESRSTARYPIGVSLKVEGAREMNIEWAPLSKHEQLERDIREGKKQLVKTWRRHVWATRKAIGVIVGPQGKTKPIPLDHLDGHSDKDHDGGEFGFHMGFIWAS